MSMQQKSLSSFHLLYYKMKVKHFALELEDKIDIFLHQVMATHL